MTTRPFIIKPLENEDRTAFDCGSDALNRYLAQQARQDMRRAVAGCFIALHRESGGIAGFYTLCATAMRLTDIDPGWSRKLPLYPLVPSALLGRLAVDSRFKGNGLGGALLIDAVIRTAGSDVTAHMMVVDAKNPQAGAFYQHHGFRYAPADRSRLYAPLSLLERQLGLAAKG